MFTTAHDAREYALAGHATITLTSKKTGARFTYRVSSPTDRKFYKREDIRFVSLLSGPDNEADYVYLGLLNGRREFYATRKSCAGPEAPSFKAFEYFARMVLREDRLPECLEVEHSGRCGRCGRLLTVPESVQDGIGPECKRLIEEDGFERRSRMLAEQMDITERRHGRVK